MTPEKEPTPDQKILIELNREWMELFDHSYTACYSLSLYDGEIGEEHRGHLAYVANHRYEDFDKE